jgi:hypothetical protein
MTSAEYEEQALIIKGGIHPAPWKSEGVNVYDSNGFMVLTARNAIVAKVVADLYNRNPVVLLEDDVVY